LRADADRAVLAPRGRDVHALQVRLELSLGDPGDLRAHAPQVLCLATRADRIANHRLFAANFTLLSHAVPFQLLANYRGNRQYIGLGQRGKRETACRSSRHELVGDATCWQLDSKKP